MHHADHVALIRAGVEAHPGTWADLGSGRGAFTLALADLLGRIGGPAGTILSIDLDAGALRSQEEAMRRRFPAAQVVYRRADFTDPAARGITPASLDGLLMANSLHFIRSPRSALVDLVALLKPGGRFVLVEYDTDSGTTWVPYPLSFATWERFSAEVGLQATHLVHRVPSRFLGHIYSAASDAPGR
ncbi:MAG TPA: methyltransferase [Actinomycetota bacterium]|nr:methyltransferase [Actinomycetota bacterium]